MFTAITIFVVVAGVAEVETVLRDKETIINIANAFELDYCFCLVFTVNLKETIFFTV